MNEFSQPSPFAFWRMRSGSTTLHTAAQVDGFDPASGTARVDTRCGLHGLAQIRADRDRPHDAVCPQCRQAAADRDKQSRRPHGRHRVARTKRRGVGA